jgi:hypothetical protein
MSAAVHPQPLQNRHPPPLLLRSPRILPVLPLLLLLPAVPIALLLLLLLLGWDDSIHYVIFLPARFVILGNLLPTVIINLQHTP